MTVTVDLARNLSEYGASVEIDVPQNILDTLDTEESKRALADLVQNHLDANNFDAFSSFESDVGTAEGLRIVHITGAGEKDGSLKIPLEPNSTALGEILFDVLKGRELDTLIDNISLYACEEPEKVKEGLRAFAQWVQDNV